jgi:hypothetical protein
MTVEEKRKIITRYCDHTNCDGCVLKGKAWIHQFRCENCLLICDADENELDRAISLIAGEKEAPSEEETSKNRIIQVEAKDVLSNIVDGKKVFRINLEKTIVCDLCEKSINCIRRDLDKPEYIYFIVEEGL